MYMETCFVEHMQQHESDKSICDHEVLYKLGTASVAPQHNVGMHMQHRSCADSLVVMFDKASASLAWVMLYH